MRKLFLENGTVISGRNFGADIDAEGEVVFTTGMSGYLETLTDPSYYGQIIVFTFPLIGNYGVPANQSPVFLEKISDDIDATFESKRIWARGVILTEFSEDFSHSESVKSFKSWLIEHNIPAICEVDTRELTQMLRETGTILGSICKRKPKKFIDELDGRFVPEVSPEKIEIYEPENFDSKKGKTIVFIDCGAKNGIFRNFLKRGIRIIRCPFDQNPFELKMEFDGLFISNGPGDPEKCIKTIETTRVAIERKVPIFGICLGNQILALAAGGKTRKMKYGHRGLNQPVQDLDSGRCLITSQNHGFEVDTKSLPKDFAPWFKNLNDNSNEGIKHKNGKIFSVQFHPEACAGPEDAEYLFDEFIKVL